MWQCDRASTSGSTNGTFYKALVCITSLLPALLVDGVRDTLAILVSALILGGMLRRASEAAQLNGVVVFSAGLTSEFDEDKFTYPRCWDFCEAMVGKIRRLRFMSRAPSRGEVIEPVTEIRAHTLYSGMPIDLATSTLIEHCFPTEADISLSRFLGAMCWDAFVTKLVPVKDIVCFPITSLLDNDDAAPLEVNVNINFRLHIMHRSMSKLRRHARIKSFIHETHRDPLAQEKQMICLLCDILAATGKFVKKRGHESHCCEIPQCVLSVQAATLGTKRDVLVNVFGNHPFIEWQEALDSECRRLGMHGAQLAFFVRRWAQERGIAYANKGNLSRFTWTLLVLYFLQHRSTQVEESADVGAVVVNSFVQFISFYTNRFLNHQERISIFIDSDACDSDTSPVRFASITGNAHTCSASIYSPTRDLRSTMAATKPSGVSPADQSDGYARAMPFIENPFERDCDLGASMDSSNVFRLWEELWRASTLLEDRSTASLVELLSPCLRPL
eukprot:TRINITY_DN10802_c0_g3_i1.p1 TRINITY_DN10802_c0_g3~~TRINITY_DN10802_c0_g3_i1.p1  ORF type:complete len:502 (-),score=44.09 TRINITY_DN10802_c0_g3_i1:266-1771(-)